MVLVRTPSPPPPPPLPLHAKACVSRNYDTNARIKFIIDTAIDDLEWKKPIGFGAYRKNHVQYYVYISAFLIYKHIIYMYVSHLQLNNIN